MLNQLSDLDLSSNYLHGAIPETIMIGTLENLYLQGNCFAAPSEAFVNFCNTALCGTCEWEPLACPVPWKTDLDALCDFFEATGGSSWTDNLGWPAPSACKTFANDTSFCTWYGVSCTTDMRRVRMLQLAGNHLVGTLPASLGQLSAMRVLNISWNAVRGSIPSNIGDLTSLEQLDLSHNGLVSYIPPGLGSASGLTHLILNNNQLVSTLPVSLANLSALRVLEAQSNWFEGVIPPLGNLSSLGYLDLSDNMLAGVFPGGPWRNLSVLVLSSNYITNLAGACEFPVLQYLDVQNNSITGLSPATPLGDWRALFYLDMSLNSMSAFPTHLCTWVKNVLPRWYASGAHCGPKNLDACGSFLSFSGNGAGGPLPACVGEHSRMQFLDFSSNNFVGTIPATFGQLWYVVSLSLAHNSLTGTIPDSLGELPALQRLNLATNALTGTVPAKCTWPNVTWLYLHSNQLTGMFPSGVWGSLLSLDVHGNLLSGFESGEYPALTYVDASGNDITDVSTFPFDLSFDLSYVDLSFNSIVGAFPGALCNWLAHVKPSTVVMPGACSPDTPATCPSSLLLSSNSILDVFPVCVTNSSGIQVVDISSNFFYGGVVTLQRMPSMLVLDISSNNFDGDFNVSFGAAAKGGSQSKLLSLDVSNNFISGDMPTHLIEIFLGELKLFMYSANCELRWSLQPGPGCSVELCVQTPQRPVTRCAKAVPAAPIGVSAKYTDVLVVTWAPPFLTHATYSPVTEYIVAAMSEDDATFGSTVHVGSTTFNAALLGLAPGIYSVSVAAVNGIGVGTPSPPNQVTVPGSILSKLEAFMIVALQFVVFILCQVGNKFCHGSRPLAKRDFMGLFSCGMAIYHSVTDFMFAELLMATRRAMTVDFVVFVSVFLAATLWSAVRVRVFMSAVTRSDAIVPQPHSMPFVDWAHRHRVWLGVVVAASCFQLSALRIIACRAFGGVDGFLSAPIDKTKTKEGSPWRQLQSHVSIVMVIRNIASIVIVLHTGNMLDAVVFLKTVTACSGCLVAAMTLIVDNMTTGFCRVEQERELQEPLLARPSQVRAARRQRVAVTRAAA